MDNGADSLAQLWYGVHDAMLMLHFAASESDVRLHLPRVTSPHVQPRACFRRSLLQGSGKSTAAIAYASDPANPHAIYVDLAGCDSFEAAAKRVADAVGYRTDCASEALWTSQRDRYVQLLKRFFRACGRVREEGKAVGGRPIMLILDHVSDPFTLRPTVPLDSSPEEHRASRSDTARYFDTLIYQTLEMTRLSDFLEQGHLRIVLITSNPMAEWDSWMSELLRCNRAELQQHACIACARVCDHHDVAQPQARRTCFCRIVVLIASLRRHCQSRCAHYRASASATAGSAMYDNMFEATLPPLTDAEASCFGAGGAVHPPRPHAPAAP